MSSIINIICAKNIDICEWGPLRSIIYIYIMNMTNPTLLNHCCCTRAPFCMLGFTVLKSRLKALICQCCTMDHVDFNTAPRFDHVLDHIVEKRIVG